MKKKYIRPESKLFVINLAENIANASGPFVGKDEVGVQFSHDAAGSCYTHYVNFDNAKVILGHETGQYVDEMQSYIPSVGFQIFGCLA